KDNNDIENEAGHSERDQSLVTRLASRQRPDQKDRPEECMKCQIRRVRQLAVEHDAFADTCQNNEEAECEEPDTMRVETFKCIDTSFTEQIGKNQSGEHVSQDRLQQNDRKCGKGPWLIVAQLEHRPPALDANQQQQDRPGDDWPVNANPPPRQ